jgi:hypothetical protein
MQTSNDKDTIRQLRAENERLKRHLYVRTVHGQRYDEDHDSYYRPGCGADDTRDSRGHKLRPRINEAGEPYWM